jgi:hypothetical protein
VEDIDRAVKAATAAFPAWSRVVPRRALFTKGIEPCVRSSRSRKVPFAFDNALYRQRNKLKDWRRSATPYDRCANTLFSAICIAAAVAFYLSQ